MPKEYRLWILARVKKAIVDYKLIEDKDNIAVGLSGGKDSTALLYALNLIRKSAPVKFQLYGISLDLGWPFNSSEDINKLRQFCKDLQVPFYYKTTNISTIVFDLRKEKNPCALCSTLRRGALNSTAQELGCNKVALGHHLDDVIETFLMSLFFTGQFRTFSPNTYLDRTGLTMIRPLVYLYQKHVQDLVKLAHLPVIDNPCPVSGMTKRQEVKQVVASLVNLYPDFRERFLHALQTARLENLWPPKSSP